MPSPLPGTQYLYDYRAAVSDGRLTTREVKERLSPHVDEIATDATIQSDLYLIVTGQAVWVDFSGTRARTRPLEATPRARMAVLDLLLRAEELRGK